MKSFALLRFRHSDLLLQLIRRDVDLKFKGAILGVLWSLVTPLLTLGIYSIVFSSFMRAKWPGVDDTADFALILFPGLILFNFFAECINRAPSLIVVNPNFVKKVVFPLDLLVWVPIGSALFNFSLSFVAWMIITWIFHGSLHWTIVLLPIVVLPLIFVILGLSWLLAGLGVYVRDIGQIVPVITQALMFLSPVLYPLENVPKRFVWLIMLNPLSLIVEQTRLVMIKGGLPNFGSLLLYTILGLTICLLGSRFFHAVRPGFADVI